MLSTILSAIGWPALVSIIGAVLGKIDNSAAKTASAALEKVSDALKTGEITGDQLSEANRHSEKMVEFEADSYQKIISEVNKTIRMEGASEDKYVRRMRPTFGYLMGFTWAAQMFGVAYVIAFQTDKAGLVIAAMSNLSAMWAVALSVLGIYVYKRSDDKKTSAGEVIYWNNPKQ